MPAAVLIAAMDRAVASGCLDPQVVLVDARREVTPPLAPSVRLAVRPARPSLAGYDHLLTGSQST
jgi:hypothetical protein